MIKSLILPGFQFRLDDLYRRPSLKEIACDPVYEKIAFPAYKKALQEVEHARREKELALQQVEQERHEKELAQVTKMAEQLRKLCIEPDEL